MRILVKIEDGIVRIMQDKADSNVQIKLVDYDVEGFDDDRLERDHKGRPCTICDDPCDVDQEAVAPFFNN